VNLGAGSGFEAWTSGTWKSTAANATTAIADIANVENVKGSSRSDTIIGNSGNNRIDGHGGSDIINAGAGADTVLGGSSNDVLNGGAGNDTLTGGTGNDIFQFGAGWEKDTETDFTVGADKIELSGIAGLTSFANLTISATSAGASVTYGANTILLQGVAATSLSAADFLFS
jgi:Ca2+-binding RTX toxin-like protein